MILRKAECSIPISCYSLNKQKYAHTSYSEITILKCAHES